MASAASQNLLVKAKWMAVYRWLALGLLSVIGIVALVSADRAAHLAQQQEQKNHLDKASRLVQSRLNSIIQIPLNTVESMQAFMLADDELPDYRSFDRFAAKMLDYTPAVGGFAYVDTNRIIRHFYPLSGNEKAIGLDLTTRPARAFVERAIREKRMTINPPAVTVQGHLSTIARIPLYRDQQFLGLVQGVIIIDKTLQYVLQGLDDNVHIALEDAAGKKFWGPAVHPQQTSSFNIKVGDTSWKTRVWLGPGTEDDHYIAPLIWLVGGALLLSLLYIVNRSFTESERLAVAVKNKTTQLSASEARWRTLLKEVSLLGVGLDRHGGISYVNPFFCHVTGFEAAELIGKDWFNVFITKDMQHQIRDVFDSIERGKSTSHFLNTIMTKSGEERVISWFNARIANERGEFDGTLSIGEDITARHELEKRLDHLAYHDLLTGLPNRALFLDRLEHAVARAQRDNTLLALLMIDLDQFKNINDSLGHFAGDLLLEEAAQRIHNEIRKADTVARLGGDEFTVLLENISQVDVVEEVAEKILKEFARPFEIENNKLYITASVGIVLYPMGDDAIDDLLRAADTAMYHAKSEGRNCYRFYQASMSDMAHNRLNLANNLHIAYQNQDFRLAYQPIVDLESRQASGFETLLRWHHTDLGWISPVEFIPIAESTGMIVQLGYWVLQHACRSYKTLRSAFGKDICLSVNVSGYQFRDKNFIQEFRRILQDEGMLPQNLIVEITESQLMEDTHTAMQVLHALRDTGCRIAIDDFGTGYSSLSYLQTFPVDILKIDRSFIADMTISENSLSLLKAILMMAASLKIDVIAEGLESAEQVEILSSLGLSTGQGFYMGKPRFLDELGKPGEKN